MRRFARTSALVGLFLQAGTAWATHPDYEGEHGFELTLLPGFGGAFTSDESVWLRTEELPRPDVRPPSPSFGSSVGVQLAAGWRFKPYFSAGLTGGYQSLSAANVYSASEASFEPSDSFRSFHVGAYARVYPLSFFNGSRTEPRVFFDTWADRRRFEPWLSLGVTFAQYTRDRRYSAIGVTDSYSIWTTRYVGVPITVGVDYRLITRLAVGLSANVTPLVAGGTSTELYQHIVRPGSDTMMGPTTTSTTPGATSNTSFFLGLSVRYTFTY